jgi:hypothetical protein
MPDEPLLPTDDDIEGHRLASNDNETVVDDTDEEPDVEGHRLAANDNETVVDDETEADPEPLAA